MPSSLPALEERALRGAHNWCWQRYGLVVADRNISVASEHGRFLQQYKSWICTSNFPTKGKWKYLQSPLIWSQRHCVLHYDLLLIWISPATVICFGHRIIVTMTSVSEVLGFALWSTLWISPHRSIRGEISSICLGLDEA